MIAVVRIILIAGRLKDMDANRPEDVNADPKETPAKDLSALAMLLLEEGPRGAGDDKAAGVGGGDVRGLCSSIRLSTARRRHFVGTCQGLFLQWQLVLMPMLARALVHWILILFLLNPFKRHLYRLFHTVL